MNLDEVLLLGVVIVVHFECRNTNKIDSFKEGKGPGLARKGFLGSGSALKFDVGLRA